AAGSSHQALGRPPREPHQPNGTAYLTGARSPGRQIIITRNDPWEMIFLNTLTVIWGNRLSKVKPAFRFAQICVGNFMILYTIMHKGVHMIALLCAKTLIVYL
ncbi:Dihydroorotate dehydrogenase B (NAD(+)), catalytic subunit, partial [Frankliniella fusca]